MKQPYYGYVCVVLGSPRRTLEDNIKMDLRETGW